jgi:hypothetical protein
VREAAVREAEEPQEQLAQQAGQELEEWAVQDMAAVQESAAQVSGMAA